MAALAVNTQRLSPITELVSGEGPASEETTYLDISLPGIPDDELERLRQTNEQLQHMVAVLTAQIAGLEESLAGALKEHPDRRAVVILGEHAALKKRVTQLETVRGQRELSRNLFNTMEQEKNVLLALIANRQTRIQEMGEIIFSLEGQKQDLSEKMSRLKQQNGELVRQVDRLRSSQQCCAPTCAIL